MAVLDQVCIGNAGQRQCLFGGGVKVAKFIHETLAKRLCAGEDSAVGEVLPIIGEHLAFAGFVSPLEIAAFAHDFFETPKCLVN